MQGFLYLALITDKYSRKIVDWHVGDTLEAIGCVRALDRALAELPEARSPSITPIRAASIAVMSM